MISKIIGGWMLYISGMTFSDLILEDYMMRNDIGIKFSAHKPPKNYPQTPEEWEDQYKKSMHKKNHEKNLEDFQTNYLNDYVNLILSKRSILSNFFPMANPDIKHFSKVIEIPLDERTCDNIVNLSFFAPFYPLIRTRFGAYNSLETRKLFIIFLEILTGFFISSQLTKVQVEEINLNKVPSIQPELQALSYLIKLLQGLTSLYFGLQILKPEDKKFDFQSNRKYFMVFFLSSAANFIGKYLDCSKLRTSNHPDGSVSNTSFKDLSENKNSTQLTNDNLHKIKFGLTAASYIYILGVLSGANLHKSTYNPSFNNFGVLFFIYNLMAVSEFTENKSVKVLNTMLTLGFYIKLLLSTRR